MLQCVPRSQIYCSLKRPLTESAARPSFPDRIFTFFLYATAGVGGAAGLCQLALQLLMSKPRASTHLLLLQLCGAALVCVLLAGFPFTGTSAIAGHWLFGAKGCVTLAVIRHVSRRALRDKRRGGPRAAR